MKTLSRIPALTLAALSGLTVAVSAQVKTAPALGPAPRLVMPSTEEGSLANGMKIIVSRNAEVPLVEVRLTIAGGARLTGVVPGLATFAPLMVTEGAASRDAFQLAEALDFLGASLGAAASWENTVIRLSAPKRNIDSALVLMSDVLLRPTFAQKDVARQRDLRQASLVTAKDSPGSVAQRVYYRSLYPAGHPYHENLSGDSATTAALDSATVRTYWSSALDPKAATLVFTGDVTLKEATAWANRHFSAWKSPAKRLTQPAASTVGAPTAGGTRIVLVDKPNAAQSVIYVGQPGIDRANPDYPALTVMNTVLGGSFSSRINHILREERGYTYGAFSSLTTGPVAGPFTVSSAVRTDVTDSSLAIIFRELNHIRDSIIPGDELTRARNYLTLGALGEFETAGEVANAIVSTQVNKITLARIGEELDLMGKTQGEPLQKLAQKYLDPTRMTIVIVGDLKKIRPMIEKLKLGPITVEKY